MKCSTPITIANPFGEATLHNSNSKMNFEVPCGRCGACKYNLRIDWTFRLKYEAEFSTSAYFITLTYNENEVNYSPHTGELILSKEDLQKFMKRLRKHDQKVLDEIKQKSKIRYYAIGEYGTKTDRPHYHILLFNATGSAVKNIKRIWGKGHVSISPITKQRIHYCTKFHVLKNKISDEYEVPEFALMSRRGGIGHQLLHDEQMMNYLKKGLKTMVTINGYKHRLPKYYKDKIFNDYEKELIRKENYQKLQELEVKEKIRLTNLGISDIKEYIRQSRFNTAQKVKLKQIERSKSNNYEYF